jgi:hypothetical protein
MDRVACAIKREENSIFANLILQDLFLMTMTASQLKP